MANGYIDMRCIKETFAYVCTGLSGLVLGFALSTATGGCGASDGSGPPVNPNNLNVQRGESQWHNLKLPEHDGSKQSN